MERSYNLAQLNNIMSSIAVMIADTLPNNNDAASASHLVNTLEGDLHSLLHSSRIDQQMINTSTQSINSVKTLTPNGRKITIPIQAPEVDNIYRTAASNLEPNPIPRPEPGGITFENDFMVKKHTAESQAILNVLYTERQKLVEQVLQNQSDTSSTCV